MLWTSNYFSNSLGKLGVLQILKRNLSKTRLILGWLDGNSYFIWDWNWVMSYISDGKKLHSANQDFLGCHWNFNFAFSFLLCRTKLSDLPAPNPYDKTGEVHQGHQKYEHNQEDDVLRLNVLRIPGLFDIIWKVYQRFFAIWCQGVNRWIVE